MPKPFVIVVTGRPGSGKTTLAHTLAQQLHCPALCRDEFKGGYVHTIGGTHASLGQDSNRRLYQIFFDTVDFVVAQGVSVVIEAAFQHAAWLPRLTPLADATHLSLVICTLAPDLARARWRERVRADPAREWFHGERVGVPAAGGSGPPAESYEPPVMDVPTLVVDTTEGYQPGLDHILAFALGGRVRDEEARGRA